MRSASAFASVRRKFANLDKDFSLNIMGMFSLLILQGDSSMMGESSDVIMVYVNMEITERDCPIGDHALLNYILCNNSCFYPLF